MKFNLFLRPEAIFMPSDGRAMPPWAAKMFLVMKLTFIFLTVAFLQVSASGVAQTVTLSERNATLEKLFSQVRKQTRFSFFITDNNALKAAKPVTIHVKGVPLRQALDMMLAGQPLTYQIFDSVIAIKRRPLPPEPAAPQPEAIRQKKPVKGHVTGEDGSPIPGVSVQVKGTSRGAATDAAGNFTLEVDNDAVLIVSFIGYQTQEIPVAGKSDLNIQLKTATSGLTEVVVVAYGSQKKVDLTGSVASVSGSELKHTPAVSVSNAITGLLPGLVTKNVTGEPGRDDATILIRGRNTTGNNNPLVVVDGIQNASGWQRINPNDIESISVLKDASAAIYGAQAANGVILITTKRGNTGKPTISYTYNQGFTQPTQIPEMGNSATLAGYFNEMLIKQGQQPQFTEEEIRKFADGSDPVNYPNVNWFDEVLRKFSPQSQHHLNVRGGNKDIRYLLSGSYSNQNSIFKKGSHNFKVYSLRSNLDAQINKYIKVSLDLNGNIDEGNYPAFNTTAAAATRQIFQALNNNLPFMPVYYANGLPSAGVERGENPAIMASDATGNSNSRIQRFFAKAGFDISIPWVEGLGADGYFNYRNVTSIGKNWQTPWTVYNYDKANNTYLPVTGGGIVLPQLTQTVGVDRNTLINLRLKYERRFNEHFVNTFVAVEQSKGRSDDLSAFRRNFISTEIDELFAGSLINQEADGTALETGRQNVFGRLHYDFREKYLLDFNFRYDGSSNFPEGRRFGFFPGVAVAWRISGENFVKERFSFIDNLKLRASIGQMGNDLIDPFQFLTLYTLGNKGYNFGLPASQSLGLTAGVTPNPFVTWEVATLSNLGLDGIFWNGLLGFTFDVFKQRRSNILATRNLAVPSFTGLSLPNENIGVVENKGFELELSHAVNKKTLSYRVSGNLAYAANKVIEISEASNVPVWQKQEGHAIDAGRYYISKGIIRTKEALDNIPVVPGTKVGDLQYEDVNGDGTITAADQVRLDRTSTPQITYGVNFSVEYKAFSLFANFAGAAKSWQPLRFQALLGYNALQELLENRYTEGSMSSKYPTLPLQSGVNSLASTFWLYNTSFMRLKTLEIGYSLPAGLLSSLKIATARVYANGSNLFTLSRMKLVDPEGTNGDGFFYPQSRIYNLGINVTF